MPISIIARVFLCIIFALLLAYLSVYHQNELTELRLLQPKLLREIEALQERNAKLRYGIDSFENPLHLMELARQPQFGYLRHPYLKEIIILPDHVESVGEEQK